MGHNPSGFVANSSFGAIRAIEGNRPQGGGDYRASPGTSVPAMVS
jgi:hypothetical protein